MRLFLFLFFLLASSLAAQEPQEPAPVEPVATEEQPPEPVNTELTSVVTEPEDPALRLGHPLDPADVATLTGRHPHAQADSRYDTRAVVYIDPGWNRRWADSADLPPFAPTIFGRFGDRPTFIFSPGGHTPRLFVPVFNGLIFVSPK